MSSPLTHLIARLLLIPILLLGIGMLVKGYGETGGGFSGGLIAALGVMLQYAVFGPAAVTQRLPLLAGTALFCACFGLLLMLLVTFLPSLWGLPPLSHQPPPGAQVVHLGTLELHTAFVFELGIFLLVFGFVIAVLHQISGGEAA